MNKALVHRHAGFCKAAQVSARAVGVDGVDRAADQQRDPLGTHLQQNTGHLAGGGNLIIVRLRYCLVLAAANQHKRHIILPQQVNAGVVCHGVGQNNTVRLMARQLTLQLGIFCAGGVAQQHVVAALISHGTDAAHTFAQKRQIQCNKALRHNHGNVVGAHLWVFLRRHRLCAGMPHIGEHLGAGFLADAPFSGKCAGHRCFGNAQRLHHLLDSHFFVFFCGHWGNLLLCIALRNKSHISITGYSFVVNVRKQQKAFCFLAER